MKQLVRKGSRYYSVAIATALLGLFGSVSVAAADSIATSDANSSCRQETRRVAVWPKGSPKSAQLTRFEERLVTVCNGKVVASLPVRDTRQASDQP